MAYNFPVGYQPFYPQAYQAPQPAQANGTGIIWVQGEAGAKSYLVAPNNTVQLWDSEKNTIYLKSADASGMPSMRILDYTIREGATAGPANISGASAAAFATKEDLQALHAQLDALRSEVDTLTSRKPRTKKEENNGDE